MSLIKLFLGGNNLVFSRPERVWSVTSRLGTGKWLTLFYSVWAIILFLQLVRTSALRTSVFLGSLTRKTGRCAPPALPIATSLITVNRKPHEKSLSWKKICESVPLLK
jgi:hypothetical protein